MENRLLVEKTFTAEGQASEPFMIRGTVSIDFSLYQPVAMDDGDLWKGGVLFQKSRDGKEWEDIEEFTYSSQSMYRGGIDYADNTLYRFFCAYRASGSATVLVFLLNTGMPAATEQDVNTKIREKMITDFLKAASEAGLTLLEADMTVQNLKGRLWGMAYEAKVTFSEPESPRQAEG